MKRFDFYDQDYDCESRREEGPTGKYVTYEEASAQIRGWGDANARLEGAVDRLTVIVEAKTKIIEDLVDNVSSRDSLIDGLEERMKLDTQLIEDLRSELSVAYDAGKL